MCQEPLGFEDNAGGNYLLGAAANGFKAGAGQTLFSATNGRCIIRNTMPPGMVPFQKFAELSLAFAGSAGTCQTGRDLFVQDAKAHEKHTKLMPQKRVQIGRSRPTFHILSHSSKDLSDATKLEFGKRQMIWQQIQAKRRDRTGRCARDRGQEIGAENNQPPLPPRVVSKTVHLTWTNDQKRSRLTRDWFEIDQLSDSSFCHTDQSVEGIAVGGADLPARLPVKQVVKTEDLGVETAPRWLIVQPKRHGHQVFHRCSSRQFLSDSYHKMTPNNRASLWWFR